MTGRCLICEQAENGREQPVNQMADGQVGTGLRCKADGAATIWRLSNH
jgi:hypothetical protein